MKRRRKADIAIDLTALLDVILILLFLVIIQINRQSAEVEAEYLNKEAALNERMDLLVEERDQALAAAGMDGDSLTAYDVFLEQTDYVSIRLETTDEGARPVVSVDGKIVRGIENEQQLQRNLGNLINGLPQSVAVVVLEYDNRSILWRDYQTYNRLILAIRADTTKTILYREISSINGSDRSNKDNHLEFVDQTGGQTILPTSFESGVVDQGELPSASR